ncbi:MAG: gliding motility-associated C-terminal domain-containing protein [Bacteroidetes bacterium]|nr:gliding motility-associated C-terminal domain-containing protein [Bacteroidota bacterium]
MLQFYPFPSVLRQTFLLILCCCSISMSQLYGQTCPTLTITPDTSICPGTFVLHSAISSGTIISRSWQPRYGLSDSTVANPTATVTHDTAYTCTVKVSSTTNLISNGDFSAGNTGFSSGYTYLSAPPAQPCGSYGILGCEADYTINTNPRNTHTQFANYGDHTSGSGQMMIVNGATSPNISVWCQTITVQPNTDYQFSAWVSNVDLNPQPLPNLRFNINGAPAGPPFSPVISSGVWTQFYTLWNSGSNTSVNICLTDSSTAGGGNDFALDDIAFIPICTLTDTVHITTFVKPTVALPADTSFCDSVYTSITPVVTGTGTLSYLWSDGSTQTLDTAHLAGLYWLQVSNQCSSSATRDSIRIALSQTPTADLGPDSVICSGRAMVIVPTVTGTSPVSYSWQDGTIDSTYTATTRGIYWLSVSNSCGAYTDSIAIDTLSAPAAFSIGSDQGLCAGAQLTLRAVPVPAAGLSLLWQDGVTQTDTFPVTAAGTYALTESNRCAATTATVTITALQPPSVSLTAVPVYCDVDSVLLAPVATAAQSYSWSTGSAQPSIYAHSSGIYAVTVTNTCATAAASAGILMLTTPSRFYSGATIDSCLRAGVTLDEQGTGRNFLWSGGQTTQAITVTDSGQYTVIISDSAGFCPTTDTVNVIFHSCSDCPTAIPTAFTPNGDGINDKFMTYSLCTNESYQITIYNRWGEKVYDSPSQADGWDGTYRGIAQPAGVYVYYVHYHTTGKPDQYHTGSLTLIR